MGLISAALGSVVGNLSDQWKEYFVCDSLPVDVLVKKGVKKGKGLNNGSDNVISNGSGVVVADGQCMIIVENGKVVEICAEPGQYTYNNTVAPSVFTGSLGQSLKDTAKDILERFKAGGVAGKDQRVYYFNTKEITGNKFGTPNPIPFRVVDNNIGFDIDLSVRASGIYSYKVTDPILFYTNVCGNVNHEYTRDEIDAQLKSEFVGKLQTGFSKLSALGLRPSELMGHTEELADAMNDALSTKWGEARGIEVASVSFSNVDLPAEDAQKLKDAQYIGMLRNSQMAGATLVDAEAEALKEAAKNANGATQGFVGVGMAMNAASGLGVNNFYQQQPAPQVSQATVNPNAWLCSCGMNNVGNYCSNCGTKRPQ